MSGKSTISIYYNFSPCKSGVSLRSTNDKMSDRIYKKFGICINKLFWNNLSNNLFNHILFNGIMFYFRKMLCRNHYVIYTNRLIIFILNRYLCFSIWTKIRDNSLFPYHSQLSCQSMSQIYRHWHQFVCFI